MPYQVWKDLLRIANSSFEDSIAICPYDLNNFLNDINDRLIKRIDNL